MTAPVILPVDLSPQQQLQYIQQQQYELQKQLREHGSGGISGSGLGKSTVVSASSQKPLPGSQLKFGGNQTMYGKVNQNSDAEKSQPVIIQPNSVVGMRPSSVSVFPSRSGNIVDNAPTDGSMLFNRLGGISSPRNSSVLSSMMYSSDNINSASLSKNVSNNINVPSQIAKTANNFEDSKFGESMNSNENDAISNIERNFNSNQ